MFSDYTFWHSLFYSLFVGVTSVFIAICFALAISISWKKEINTGRLSNIIYLPLCFPAIVVTFFSYQFLAQSGFLSRLFYNLHITNSIKNFPVLINDAFGIGIIFTMVILITPFFILLFRQLYIAEKINSLSNLGATLGATNWQILTKITIPILIKKSIVSIVLFVVFVMSSYEVPLLLGRQNPQMISVLIIQKVQRFNLLDIPQGYAMSIVYVILIIVLLLILYFSNPQFFNPNKQND
ncbi:MAG: putative spermidine/putrescine transport system permease protein [Flavobacterium sp.]